jgi:hypothetical protein
MAGKDEPMSMDTNTGRPKQNKTRLFDFTVTKGVCRRTKDLRKVPPFKQTTDLAEAGKVS